MTGFRARPLDETTWPDFARLVERHNGYGAAAGAWGFTPKAWGARRWWRRTDPRRNAESGRAGLTPPSCTTARPVWAGASSARPMSPIKHRRAYLEGLSALPDWRITCFFTDSKYRRQGVASAALEGALHEIARLGGGTVESYPEDTEGRSVSSSFLYSGMVSMFEAMGSSEPVASVNITGWSPRSCPEASARTPACLEGAAGLQGSGIQAPGNHP
jgi:GNAT superfamily N-acetyltransferase